MTPADAGREATSQANSQAFPIEWVRDASHDMVDIVAKRQLWDTFLADLGSGLPSLELWRRYSLGAAGELALFSNTLHAGK